MAFEFPDPNTTTEFEAANGIVYSWDVTDGKWVVKAYKSSTEEYVPREEFIDDQQRQDEDIAVLEQLVKGPSYTYTIDNNIGAAVSRPGEIGCNAGYWSALTKFSFGTADGDGNTTPTMSNGDVIEVYNAGENKTNRYKITNASGAPTLVEVQYISGTYFFIKGDVIQVQVYTDSNVAALEARVTVGEDLQGQIEARVTAGEDLQGQIQQTQQEIQENILTLQQEIDALENTRYVGTWNAIDDASKNGRTPGDGNFYFNQGALATDWSLVAWLYIANVDSNGVTFTHSDIQVGDQIEVISKTDNSYGIYTIESTTDGSDYMAIRLEVMNRSDGVPATGPHLIKIFSIDVGIDLNEADERYVRKTGGSMTGALEIDKSGGNSIILKKEGTTNLKLWADGSAETTKTTFSDNHLVTKDYVDTAIAGVVGPDSDTFATLATEQTFTATAKKTVLSEFVFNRDQGKTAVRFFLNDEQAAQVYYDGANSTRFQIQEGYEFKLVTTPIGGDAQQVIKTYTDGGIRVEKLKEPQQDHHATTRKYVDDAIAAALSAPARLRWRYNSAQTATDPGDGYFKLATTSANNTYLRLSFTTADGTYLKNSGIGTDVQQSMTNGPIVTIWYYHETDGWRMKRQMRVEAFRWDYNNHFEFRLSHINGTSNFTEDTIKYYITVGGFF